MAFEPPTEVLEEVDVDQELSDFASNLEQVLARVVKDRERAEERAKEARDKEHRVKKTLSNLQGKATTPAKRRAQVKNWVPSQDKQNEVVKIIARAGEIGYGELADNFPWSRGTLDAALRVLREDEQIRIARREGNSPIYKVMA